MPVAVIVAAGNPLIKDPDGNQRDNFSVSANMASLPLALFLFESGYFPAVRLSFRFP